jgi:starch phosphorylase
MLSLRMAEMTNAVSSLHAKKGIDIWADHPMKYVTNGIHLRTWDTIKSDLVLDHATNKQKLLEIIKKQTGIDWPVDTLLLGWARRFVEYKRPLAIVEDLERFCTLARNSTRPFKIVFAGEPHESDTNGHEMVLKLQTLIKEKIGDIAVYLPGFNMELAHTLVAGCDVWLNTPIVGFEACGTSGMKAALNGTLPCTTRDGWVDEVDMFRVGWALDSDHLSENILDILEHNIAPIYYDQKTEWAELMKNARKLIQDQFSTTRMLRQYIEQLYFPKKV